ncbi:uncharacterized protein G2W53_044159 [Senna tora]|uniref:Uncharacterized protein n=1 Tax=Senna tora TaxID=362788 RepID=A0A834SLV7_9FABA|nr:uncharacterized protein G2W53_044159 [Senna tora]
MEEEMVAGGGIEDGSMRGVDSEEKK